MGDKNLADLTCCWTVPFYFHLETFHNAFALFFFFQLCFAYKGTLKDVVGLKFTYRNTDGETLTETAKINSVFTKSHKWVKTMMCFVVVFLLKNVCPQFSGTDIDLLPWSFLCRWGYKCIDMQSSLQTDYVGSSYSLLEVYLYKDDSDADFYVDVVYIGKMPTTMDNNGK